MTAGLGSNRQIREKNDLYIASVFLHIMDGCRSLITLQDVRTDLGARLKFTWERSGVNERIQKFRELNKDFVEMGNEIVKIFHDGDTSSKNIPGKTSSYNDTPSKLHSYKRIQHASLELYRTISEKWYCGIHEKHIVHICSLLGLEEHTIEGSVPFIIVIGPHNNSSEQTYNLELEVQHCRCNATTSMASKPAETTQDTSNSQIISGAGLLSQNPTVNHLLSSLQKGSHGWIPHTKPNDQRKLKRRPKFSHIHENLPLEDLALTNTSINEVKAQSTQNLAVDIQSDLRRVSDHCNHFWKRRGICTERTCLGYLSDQCTEQFFVQPASTGDNRSSVSLADLIRKVSANSLIPSLSRQLIMNLARSIADVVLQLYPSPWLSDRWESNDIHFFGIEEPETKQNSLKPYLPYVTLKFGGDSKGKGVTAMDRQPLGIHTPNSSMSHISDTTIRNERLFCLGIVFLELGYTKPWDVLKSAVVTILPANRNSDYFVAKRLARDLVPHMGMKYVRIVLQCIGCDFGLGETELDDEELQKKFIEDIVEVLQALRDGLAAI